MISSSKAGTMIGGQLVDLLAEYYAVTEAMLRKAPEAVFAVTIKTMPEMNDLMDNNKLSDSVVVLLTKELDRISIKEIEK